MKKYGIILLYILILEGILVKLKNLCVFGITAFFSLSAVISAYGASIKINNETLESETEPQIIEGRTMVPVRAIFEGVGATVDWNADTKTVTGKKGSDTVIMNVGEKAMTVNGEKIDMDGEAMIIDSRAFAPARYVAEAFGYDVSWNGDTKEVIIKDKIASPASVTTTQTTTKETTTEITTEKATETTTKASETTTTQTTVETTTETTTMSAADIINSSPVQGVGKSLYQLVKNDINTAFIIPSVRDALQQFSHAGHGQPAVRVLAAAGVRNCYDALCCSGKELRQFRYFYDTTSIFSCQQVGEP